MRLLPVGSRRPPPPAPRTDALLTSQHIELAGRVARGELQFGPRCCEVLQVPAASFRPVDSTIDWTTTDAGYLYATTDPLASSEQFWANLVLPEGARIVYLDLYYHDESTIANIAAKLVFTQNVYAFVESRTDVGLVSSAGSGGPSYAFAALDHTYSQTDTRTYRLLVGTDTPSSALRFIGYTYSPGYGYLETVTYPDGRKLHYSYKLPGLPLMVKVEDDDSPRKVLEAWDYDSQERANHYHRGDGTVDALDIDYSSWVPGFSEATTRVIRSTPAGPVSTTYQIDRAMRVVRSTTGGAPAIDGPCPDCVDSSAESASFDFEPYRPAIQRITAVRDSRGYATFYEYGDDEPGRLWNVTRITEAAGTAAERTTEICRDPDFNQPVWVSTKSLGSCTPGVPAVPGCDDTDASEMNVTRTVSASTGNVLTEEVRGCTGGSPLPLRHITYTYTTNGQLKSVTPQSGAPTTYLDYYTTAPYRGWPQQIRYPLGLTVTYDDDSALGGLTRFTDFNGVKTEYLRDEMDRVVTHTVKGSPPLTDLVTSYTYDKVGHLQTLRRPNQQPAGPVTTYVENDSAHRLTDIVDPVGNRISFAYDSMSRVEEVKRSAPDLVAQWRRSYTYDDYGRVATTTLDTSFSTEPPSSVTEAYGHDTQGNLTSIVDPGGHLTLLDYDPLNRLELVTKLDGQANVVSQIGYRYNARDNLVEVRHPNQLITKFGADDLARVTSEDSSDSGVTSYAYDDRGRLHTALDARGRYTIYDWDDLDRLTDITYSLPSPADDVHLIYDDPTPGRFARGRLSSFSDPGGNGDYHYDRLGNLTREIRTGIAAGELTYRYDDNSNQTHIVYPLTGRDIQYTYDAADRVSSVAQVLPAPLTLASVNSYAPMGPPASVTLGNGLTLSRFYDRSYRLRDHEVTSPASGTIFRLAYAFNDDLLLESIDDYTLLNTGDRTFGYDALHQLRTATAPHPALWGTATWTYDGNGNRTQETIAGQTRQFNYADRRRKNRLTSISSPTGTTDFAYDPAGKTTLIKSPSLEQGLTYNAAGRLQHLDSTPGTDPTYSYDLRGRVLRIETPSAGTDILRYGAGASILDEKRDRPAPAGISWRSYVWLFGQPLARIDRDAALTDTIQYYINDHLGTPLATTDATGGWTWRVEYEPFGTAYPQVSTIPDRLRSPGQFHDEIGTGLYQNWHRDYSPALGRYLTTDPINSATSTNANTWNTYAFVDGNPLLLTDPTGLYTAGDVIHRCDPKKRDSCDVAVVVNDPTPHDDTNGDETIVSYGEKNDGKAIETRTNGEADSYRGFVVDGVYRPGSDRPSAADINKRLQEWRKSNPSWSKTGDGGTHCYNLVNRLQDKEDVIHDPSGLFDAILYPDRPAKSAGGARDLSYWRKLANSPPRVVTPAPPSPTPDVSPQAER